MRNLIYANKAQLEAATGLPQPRRHKTISEREFIARQRKDAAKRVRLARKVARAEKAAR